MVIDGKIFEKGFISESKFLNESTPTGQKILPHYPYVDLRSIDIGVSQEKEQEKRSYSMFKG